MIRDIIFDNIDEKSPEKSSVKSSVKLVLFYADWCQYSKRLIGYKQPDPRNLWDHVVYKYSRQNSIIIESVNYDDQETIIQYGISAFPTILMFKDGHRIEYTGDWTLENIVKFVNLFEI